MSGYADEKTSRRRDDFNERCRAEYRAKSAPRKWFISHQIYLESAMPERRGGGHRAPHLDENGVYAGDCNGGGPGRPGVCAHGASRSAASPTVEVPVGTGGGCDGSSSNSKMTPRPHAWCVQPQPYLLVVVVGSGHITTARRLAVAAPRLPRTAERRASGRQATVNGSDPCDAHEVPTSHEATRAGGDPVDRSRLGRRHGARREVQYAFTTVRLLQTSVANDGQCRDRSTRSGWTRKSRTRKHPQRIMGFSAALPADELRRC